MNSFDDDDNAVDVEVDVDSYFIVFMIVDIDSYFCVFVNVDSYRIRKKFQ